MKPTAGFMASVTKTGISSGTAYARIDYGAGFTFLNFYRHLQWNDENRRRR